MADIQTDLNTIANGKYGKDVRQAIHDAIETCYSDGKVGSIDLVARERIDNIVVSGNKELTEQTLWSGSIYGTGASASLASAITNFDYIDLYVTKEGNVSIHTIPASRGTYIIRESNLPDDGAASFSICEAGVTFTDNSTISLYKEMYFSYENGTATGRIVNPTDADSQSLLHLVKVIGRKAVANTEVVDLRTPADGMEVPEGGYSTAGDAVRGQISELKSEIAQLSGIPTAVKNALDTLFQNVAFKNTDVYTDEIAVVHNWATAVNLISISAVFNQGTNVIYNTDSLETLKQYLTVTASYNDGTSETVIGYTLSGTLVEGTSTITVTYGGKTTTFDVVVSGRNPLIYSLYDTSFTKSADGVDTQIQLMDEDRDFTILFDGTQGSSSSDTSARYFQCLQTASPWKGIYVGSASGGGRTKTSVQWNQASQFIEYGISTEGRLRLLYSHVKGSDSVTVKWKKDTGSLETFTLSNSFLQHTGALWIGSTASNNWVGTLNKFEVYDIVIGSDVENTFFGDE